MRCGLALQYDYLLSWGQYSEFKKSELCNRLFDALHYVVHVVVSHIGTCGQAEAHLEEVFLYTIGIGHATPGSDHLIAVERKARRASHQLIIERKYTAVASLLAIIYSILKI